MHSVMKCPEQEIWLLFFLSDQNLNSIAGVVECISRDFCLEDVSGRRLTTNNVVAVCKSLGRPTIWRVTRRRKGRVSLGWLLCEWGGRALPFRCQASDGSWIEFPNGIKSVSDRRISETR